jgi:transmembrane 9 superfamily member 2/4
VIPYKYNHFDFCLAEEANSPDESSGQVMFGERIGPSPYSIKFLENKTCAPLCKKTYRGGESESDRRLFYLKKGISLNYQHHWIIDNMPVTWCYPLSNEEQKRNCSTGFPMGCLVRKTNHPEDDESCPINSQYNKSGTYYPFNHVDLLITYHSGAKKELGNTFKQNGGRIVSVKVTPSSIHHTSLDLTPDSCNNISPMEIPTAPLKSGKSLDIIYSYSVKFVQNNTIELKSQWDRFSFFKIITNTDKPTTIS